MREKVVFSFDTEICEPAMNEQVRNVEDSPGCTLERVWREIWRQSMKRMQKLQDEKSVWKA